MNNRRISLKKGLALGAALFALCVWSLPAANAQLPGGTLDPLSVPKYETPLVIPPAMPTTSTISQPGMDIDYYEIAVREFQQNILPDSMGLPTTVWSYGSVNHPGTFNYPAFTI